MTHNGVVDVVDHVRPLLSMWLTMFNHVVDHGLPCSTIFKHVVNHVRPWLSIVEHGVENVVDHVQP